MSHSQSGLQFNVLKNSAVHIVRFTGELTDRTAHLLESCWSELSNHDDTTFIFIDFGKVTQVTLDALPALTKLQKEIRAKSCELRLCNLPEPIKEKLAKLGVIRSAELAPRLKDALMSVMSKSSAGRAA